MPRAQTLKVFDYVAGSTETRKTMEEVHVLVKRAAFIALVGRDMLLKDAAGKILQEVYEARKYFHWFKEHPEVNEH